ncbi:Fc receptor-like protein 6 isoform X2 [Gasterosteus aculeatus]
MFRQQQQDSMEVTSLMRTAMLLLLAQDHVSCSQKAAFPRVDPNRRQLFEYEPLAVSCEGLEGLTGWRVMRRIRGLVGTCSPHWSTSTGACRITNAIQGDTGEYWCEMGAARTGSVNITVTGGPVILESPVLPVAAGEATTLSCRGQRGTSSLTADFYKDGRLMENSSSLNITILGVSKSNEGLYACSLSGATSPASWLLVRAEEPHPFPPPLHLLAIGVGVSFVALLLLVGILQRWKRRAAPGDPPPSQASSPQPGDGHQPSFIAARHTSSVCYEPMQMTPRSIELNTEASYYSEIQETFSAVSKFNNAKASLMEPHEEHEAE